MAAGSVITLLSDFGVQDAYVGIMKGVILGIAPEARLVDLTHEIPPRAVSVGALLLRSAVDYFPSGTVHLAVVDPGVGSARHPVAVFTERGVLVGPDNGLLFPSAMAMGLRQVRCLEREDFFRLPVSQTFHGRDIFAPVAAHLTAGIQPQELGSRLLELQPLHLPQVREERGALHGEVLHIDQFGNLITNVPAAALRTFPAQKVSVRICGMSIGTLSSAYAAVPEGAVLAIVGSWGMLEIAVRGGNAAEQLRAATGTSVIITGEHRSVD